MQSLVSPLMSNPYCFNCNARLWHLFEECSLWVGWEWGEAFLTLNWSEIWDHVYYSSSVGQQQRSIYRPTLGRYVNRVSTATRPTYRPRFGRVSVWYRSSISRLSVEHRPIYRRMCVSTDTVFCRYLTDTRSICGRPSVSRVSVDMSVVNCPTLHWCCVDILLLSVDIKKIKFYSRGNLRLARTNYYYYDYYYYFIAHYTTFGL